MTKSCLFTFLFPNSLKQSNKCPQILNPFSSPFPEKEVLSNNKQLIAQNFVLKKLYTKSGEKYYFKNEKEPKQVPKQPEINKFNNPRVNTVANFQQDKKVVFCAFELQDAHELLGKHYCTCYHFQCYRICTHVSADKYIIAQEQNKLIVPMQKLKRGRMADNLPALVRVSEPRRFKGRILTPL